MLCCCQGKSLSTGRTHPLGLTSGLLEHNKINLSLDFFFSYLTLDILWTFVFAQESSFSGNWVLATTLHVLHQPESNCPMKYNSCFMPQQIQGVLQISTSLNAEVLAKLRPSLLRVDLFYHSVLWTPHALNPSKFCRVCFSIRSDFRRSFHQWCQQVYSCSMTVTVLTTNEHIDT